MIDINTSPDKLKKSILQEAMQGKLTQQLSTDGNASDLLQSIAEEKQRLYKAGKIKKPKQLAAITDDEIPFKIPDNWQWVKLGTIVHLKIGKTPPRHNSEYWNGNIPWVSVKDINNGILNSTNEGITDRAANEKFKNNIIPKGTMLMSFKLSIGKVCILGKPAYHNEAIVSLNFYKYGDRMKQYLFRIIKFLTKFAKSKNAIEGQTLNKTSLKNMLIPLPPLVEQKRIVTKLDALLPKVDSFKQSFHYIQALRSELAPRLRRSFLQEAMQGQLTQQLPEDGNASDLLQSIAEEKQRLYKAGKIKKQKQLTAITDDEIPFKIPDNWQWVRLNNISTVRSGKRVPKGMKLSSKYSDGSIHYLRVSDMKNNDVDTSNLRYANKNIVNKISKYRIYNEDIYITVAGTIAKIGIIPKCLNGMLLTENADRITPILIDKKFMMYSLLSPYIQRQILSLVNKVAQPKLSMKNINNLKFILPPLTEQKRIVDKLDSLLSNIQKI